MDIVCTCTDVLNMGFTFCTQLFSVSFWFDLLITYKYWIVLIGALIEGEIILMIAAASAYHGHISIYYVAIFAATGAIIHDHALYYLGHKLEKRLKDGKKMRHVRRIYNLVDKYGIYFVAMFRFLYGIRTITPIILGASHKFSLKKYSLFVCVSAVLWAVIITYLGYTFAIMFEWLIGEFKRIKSIIFYGVLSALIIATSVYFIRKFAKKNKEDQL